MSKKTGVGPGEATMCEENHVSARNIAMYIYALILYILQLIAIYFNCSVCPDGQIFDETVLQCVVGRHKKLTNISNNLLVLVNRNFYQYLGKTMKTFYQSLLLYLQLGQRVAVRTFQSRVSNIYVHVHDYNHFIDKYNHFIVKENRFIDEYSHFIDEYNHFIVKYNHFINEYNHYIDEYNSFADKYNHLMDNQDESNHLIIFFLL